MKNTRRRRRAVGLVLAVVGAAGLVVVALDFALLQHSIWMGSAKRLIPDQERFSRDEVVAIIVRHVERTKAHYLAAAGFALLLLVGSGILFDVTRSQDNHIAPPEGPASGRPPRNAPPPALPET